MAQKLKGSLDISKALSIGEGITITKQTSITTPATNKATIAVKTGEGNATGVFVKSDAGIESQIGTAGQYALKFDETANHHVYHGFFWATGTNLSKTFFWDAWIKPNATGGYIISEGYGGSHSLLFGTNGIGVGTYNNMTGNIWDGTSSISFGSDDGAISGEWMHVGVGSDTNKIVVYINGVPSGSVAYSLTQRRAQQGTLFVGGSGHSNYGGLIAQMRGFEGANPLVGSFDNANRVLMAYRPETRFSARALQRNSAGTILDTSFLADYTTPAVVVPDHSSVGYGSTWHAGQLWSTTGFSDASISYGFGANTVSSKYPLPKFIVDVTAPYAQVDNAPTIPTSATLTPPSTPSGALVFDSFSRANQTFAFDTTTPTLGTTETGSLGALTWSYNIVGGSDGRGDAAFKWGILNGRACALGGPSHQVAYVNVNQSNMEVSVDRRVLATYHDGRTGLSFRYQDSLNYWYVTSDGTNPAAQTIYWGYYSAGSRTNVGSGAAPANTTWTTLKVTASAANQITIYCDATQIAQFTNSQFSTETRAGLYMDDFGNGFSGLARFDNFTVKSF